MSKKISNPGKPSAGFGAVFKIDFAYSCQLILNYITFSKGSILNFDQLLTWANFEIMPNGNQLKLNI